MITVRTYENGTKIVKNQWNKFYVEYLDEAGFSCTVHKVFESQQDAELYVETNL